MCFQTLPLCIRNPNGLLLCSPRFILWWWWTECSVLGGKPAICAPHEPGAVPRVPGPTATAWMDPTWRASTEAESPGGTHLSGNERREAHHVPSWMRSYPRDPTDPPIPHPLLSPPNLFACLAKFPSFSCSRSRIHHSYRGELLLLAHPRWCGVPVDASIQGGLELRQRTGGSYSDAGLGQRLRRAEQRGRRAVVAAGAGQVPADRQREPDHEEGAAGQRQDQQGRQGDGAGVRLRVHLLHHGGGLRQVPAREAQDHQRRRPALGHDHARLRGLRRPAQALPPQVPRDRGREGRRVRRRLGLQHRRSAPAAGRCGAERRRQCRRVRRVRRRARRRRHDDDDGAAHVRLAAAAAAAAAAAVTAAAAAASHGNGRQRGFRPSRRWRRRRLLVVVRAWPARQSVSCDDTVLFRIRIADTLESSKLNKFIRIILPN